MSGVGPSLHPGEIPSWTVLKFPPDPAPDALPPPYDGSPSLRTPFPILADIYNSVLDLSVPITIATVYAVSVTLLNRYNKSRGNKPWSISKTGAFKAFVILHNVFLAAYSALTCYAMFQALKRTFPNWREPNAFIGTVDALCKIHGPRGLGDAATYDTATSKWVNKNRLIKLDPQGLPDSTDVGRMWNEGLAFWGWWFYLSKFYEVLDTVIILAKGKRSSTLQTYHHAGAMLCMWAGIRYMAPPIWIFVLVNSGIHAMMYTYYTVSALRIRVPQVIKRTLTTLQITQFIGGGTLAALYLFVSYTVPVSVPYEPTETTISKATASLASPEAVATATGAAVAFLKKLVYRAAGEEGLAENIGSVGQAAHGVHTPSPAAHDGARKVAYRTEYQSVPCIDTSGQAVAVYLNVLYLAPLTFLFVRFFIKSYLRRTSPGTKHMTKQNALSKSSNDAIRGVERELEALGKAPEDMEDIPPTSQRGRRGSRNRLAGRPSLSPDNQKFVQSVKIKVNERLEQIGEGPEASRERAKQLAKEIVEKAEKAEKEGNGEKNGKA
ncbi:uncharacterized protein EI97DRAFT_449956 [Westerdykella ornata]|uniref:Elongation of fatty acids protein n=1 Tax=Westerdykella ornata TaxID=318751 RepID=A0A6A6JQN1_WESOR|nr:uncharacterized protein EI97DRAFT_449956 [Westerdykella ornata]KAF2277269.1 hypothetical protein EI97DRAFT_449956 [Westerdykella ornata]